jgi:hypothetical protein
MKINTFAVYLGTKLRKRNEKPREINEDISEVYTIFKIRKVSFRKYCGGVPR